MEYGNRKLVRDDGPSSERPSTENPRWRKIREWSVAEFVERVVKRLGASNDRRLRHAVYEMVFSDGAKSFKHGPLTYSGAMVLDLWAGRQDDAFAPFPNKREWDEFCDAMRKLRDPDVPMFGDRRALIRIGETIDARQRPHGERMGWLR